MVAEIRPNPLEAISPQNEPELQGAEAAAQRDLPVTEVSVVIAGDEIGGGEGEGGAEPRGVLYFFFIFFC